MLLSKLQLNGALKPPVNYFGAKQTMQMLRKFSQIQMAMLPRIYPLSNIQIMLLIGNDENKQCKIELI
ncbi:hypothetical protein [Undibacterium sp. TJN19]|uniref:hypothetical protein n=1 Tax=Undibacterium sp. TJN19 TaxID=3413055 RepID=UPI003BF29BE8